MECKSEIKDFFFHGRNKDKDNGFLVQPDLRIIEPTKDGTQFQTPQNISQYTIDPGSASLGTSA